MDALIPPIDGSRVGLVSFIFFTESQNDSEVFSAGKSYLQSMITTSQMGPSCLFTEGPCKQQMAGGIPHPVTAVGKKQQAPKRLR